VNGRIVNSAIAASFTPAEDKAVPCGRTSQSATCEVDLVLI
jgi:hypothetical protein